MIVEKAHLNYLASNQSEKRNVLELIKIIELLTESIVYSRKYVYMRLEDGVERSRFKCATMHFLVDDGLIEDCVFIGYSSLNKYDKNRGDFYSYLYTTLQRRVSYRIRCALSLKQVVFNNKISYVEEDELDIEQEMGLNEEFSDFIYIDGLVLDKNVVSSTTEDFKRMIRRSKKSKLNLKVEVRKFYKTGEVR